MARIKPQAFLQRLKRRNKRVVVAAGQRLLGLKRNRNPAAGCFGGWLLAEVRCWWCSVGGWATVREGKGCGSEGGRKKKRKEKKGGE